VLNALVVLIDVGADDADVGADDVGADDVILSFGEHASITPMF